MTFEHAVEVPIEQAGADSCAPADAATPSPEAGGEQAEVAAVLPEMEAAPLPARKLPLFLDHDSQEYEDNLTKRIRETAPTFIAKYDAAKAAAHVVREMKNKLAFDLALKKAILLHKGGRGSEWGSFVESIGLVIRTVDRWIEQKLDNDELPVWATERLRATQHEPEQLEPEPEPEETEAKPLVRFTENRLEIVLPFSADEKAEFVEYLRFITAEEAKQFFIEAMRKAAEAKRGLSTSLGVNDAPQRQSLAWLDDEPLAEEKPSENVVSDVLPQAASPNPAEEKGELV